jgi:hypothetical protein
VSVGNEFEAQEIRIALGATAVKPVPNHSQKPVAFARTVSSDRFRLSLSIPSRIAVHRQCSHQPRRNRHQEGNP